MTARRTYSLAELLIAGFIATSFFCWADSGAVKYFSVAEYRSELDQLLVATKELDSSGRDIPPILRDLPPSWRVRTEQQDFAISAEGLRSDVRKFGQEQNLTTASAIRARLRSLRTDHAGC